MARTILGAVLLIAFTDIALQLDNALAISSVASGVSSSGPNSRGTTSARNHTAIPSLLRKRGVSWQRIPSLLLKRDAKK